MNARKRQDLDRLVISGFFGWHDPAQDGSDCRMQAISATIHASSSKLRTWNVVVIDYQQQSQRIIFRLHSGLRTELVHVLQPWLQHRLVELVRVALIKALLKAERPVRSWKRGHRCTELDSPPRSAS